MSSNAHSPTDDGRHVALAEVARPHGMRGELRLKVYNPDSELLLRLPPIRLVLADGSESRATLQAVRAVPGALLARLEGVVDRQAAEALRGARLEVSRAELEPPPEGEYYACDLQGCEVRLGAATVGTVLSVASYPTCDALVIGRGGGGRLEVPLCAQYVGRIDVGRRTIDLATIDGLE